MEVYNAIRFCAPKNKLLMSSVYWDVFYHISSHIIIISDSCFQLWIGMFGSDFVDCSKTPTAVSKVEKKEEVEMMGALTPIFNQNERMMFGSPMLAAFSCTVCGKSFAYKHVLENHIETHMDNAYPCDICNKIFKTRNSLKSHLSQKHRNANQEKSFTSN